MHILVILRLTLNSGLLPVHLRFLISIKQKFLSTKSNCNYDLLATQKIIRICIYISYSLSFIDLHDINFSYNNHSLFYIK